MKKVISLIAASLMMVCIFAGCAGGDTGSGSSAGTSDSNSSSSSASESSSSESTGKTDYLAWTMKEWKAASDSEKEDAAIAFAMYTYELLGTSGITEDMIRTQVGTLVTTIDTSFGSMPEAASSFTLKQIADAGTSVLSSND